MPTQATSRRDPRNTGKGISTHHGFTVIELMMTIGVLAVITSLALPSYRTILEKRQVTSGAEQIGAFLSTAQLESVKRNQFVAVNYQEQDGGWCLGMRSGENATVDCDCTVTDLNSDDACLLNPEAADPAARDLRVFNSSNLNYPDVLQSAAIGEDDTIVYDPVRGLMQDAETVNMELESEDSSYALAVGVTVTGRVKICSNDADKDVPGYKECEA